MILRTSTCLIAWRILFAGSLAIGCAAPAPPSAPHPGTQAFSSPGVTALVRYDDGAPAAGASVVVTDRSSATEFPAVFSGADGRIVLPVTAGEYALAATAQHGFGWVETIRIAAEPLRIGLSRQCHIVSGYVVGFGGDRVDVKFNRHSSNLGDTFVARATNSGRFSVCLPASDYTVLLAGDMLSSGVGISVPSATPLAVQGYRTSDVRHVPDAVGIAPHDRDGLIDDIRRADPILVGLGEGTHGSAEFVTLRAQLTFDLAQRTGLGLVLLENDAIAAFELERYVTGEDVDVAKAIAGLRFWTTDTYEFVQFIKDLRDYNSRHSSHMVHVWGIDLQNTSLPVSVLVANAQQLKLSEEEQELLRAVAPNHADAVKRFERAQRAALDALLSRLSTASGPSAVDTLLAVAARSLAVQVGYTDGDSDALFDERRDNGMAQLARFVIDRTHASRACLWAHNDHVSRRAGGTPTMGFRLSTVLSGRYYPIGFFFVQGSARAWDAAGKVGVISHTMRPAPPFTVEGALHNAAGGPEVAWFSIARLPAALRTWLETTRYVRELGAVYFGEERAMIPLDITAAFDGLVVIKTIHDSTPTPTGERRAKKK